MAYLRQNGTDDGEFCKKNILYGAVSASFFGISLFFIHIDNIFFPILSGSLGGISLIVFAVLAWRALCNIIKTLPGLAKRGIKRVEKHPVIEPFEKYSSIVDLDNNHEVYRRALRYVRDRGVGVVVECDEREMSIEEQAYWLLVNIMGRALRSGEYHIYRGVLSPQGYTLLASFKKASRLGPLLGFSSDEESEVMQKNIAEDIAEIG